MQADSAPEVCLEPGVCLEKVAGKLRRTQFRRARMIQPKAAFVRDAYR